MAIEDYNRHKADNEANATPTKVFDTHTRTWKEVTWRDIRVGDLVCVERDAIFPADLLFLFAGSVKAAPAPPVAPTPRPRPWLRICPARS